MTTSPDRSLSGSDCRARADLSQGFPFVCLTGTFAEGRLREFGEARARGRQCLRLDSKEFKILIAAELWALCLVLERSYPSPMR